MIWKNPFLLRQTEKIDSEVDFLQLFSAEALNFMSEEALSKVQFIRSSPGAGKTTVFKALQADVLNTLYKSRNVENLKDYYEFICSNKIIEHGQVKLLSCLVSCAKNYDLIDEIYQNGRRQQVLFALLNVRITILSLKSIMSILSMQKTDELVNISFKNFPEGFGALEDVIQNGFQLYKWARAEEKKICDYIDELSEEKTNFSLMYNDLFFLKLFEPSNVFHCGEKFLNYTLIIFDDMQKLTAHQRKSIVTCLYTMRPIVGVWIGERLEALTYDEIISTDANVGREFDITGLEEYWRKNNNEKSYKKVLGNIADRRVKLNYADTIGNFNNCVTTTIDVNKYSKQLKKFISETCELLQEDKILAEQYRKLIDYCLAEDNNLYEQAKIMQLLKIKYKRDMRGQIKFEMTEADIIEEFQSFCRDSNNKNAAELYLALSCSIPYYYGIEKIKELSSYNIEQFLSFAGAIFERSIAKKIMQSSKNSSYTIGAEEQEKYLKEVADKRWQDIMQRFVDGEIMQIFLKNLCEMAQNSRDSGTNPYTGGSITGIAIAERDIEELKEKYALLFRTISNCISSNYFEKRMQEHGGKMWMILYFNRWLCLKFDLPLKYGGWKKMKLDKLTSALVPNNLFVEKALEDIDQIIFEGYEAV